MSAEGRRGQLLDACAVVVDTEGFHAVTIDRVAAACGVTRTVVYQQFGGLDGMLDALIERASQRAGAAVSSATAADSGETRSLRASMARVLDAVDADPATWRMFLVAPQAGPPALAEALARGRSLIRDGNIAAIEHRSGSGSGSAGDPELAARMLQVVADELVRLRLADPTTYTTERILAQFESVGSALLGPGRSGRSGRPRSAGVGEPARRQGL
jgi:AcrR family transcriptional regulator